MIKRLQFVFVLLMLSAGVCIASIPLLIIYVITGWDGFSKMDDWSYEVYKKYK